MTQTFPIGSRETRFAPDISLAQTREELPDGVESSSPPAVTRETKTQRVKKNAEAVQVGTLFCPFVTSPRQTHLRTCAGDLQAMALGGCSASSRGNVCALSLANIAPRQPCAARIHGSHLAVRAFSMQYRIIRSSNVGGTFVPKGFLGNFSLL